MRIVTSTTMPLATMTPISHGSHNATQPWMAAAGTLTSTITRMANIPLFTMADSDPFVFTEASLDKE